MTHLLPIVFVPQFTARDRRDISGLKQYGRIEILSDHHLYPDDVDEAMPRLWAAARAKLLDFNPGMDYLALVGSPMMIAACAFILGARFALDPVRVRLLRYDRLENAYYIVDIGAIDHAGPIQS